MPRAEFSLQIDASEVERYYRGVARNVIVRATNGLKIQFPANLILPYISREGVKGLFVLEYDDSGKAQSLSKLSN